MYTQTQQVQRIQSIQNTLRASIYHEKSELKVFWGAESVFAGFPMGKEKKRSKTAPDGKIMKAAGFGEDLINISRFVRSLKFQKNMKQKKLFCRFRQVRQISGIRTTRNLLYI